MNPHNTGKAYDQITHLWETDGFNINNGIDQHTRAIVFVMNKVKPLDVGCGCVPEGFSPEGVDVISKTKTKIIALVVALFALCSRHSQDLQRLWLVLGIGCQK